MKKQTKFSVEKKFTFWWENTLNESESHRITFYKTLKSVFKCETEKYLEFEFEQRKLLSKLRCSSHPLEVEIGRHYKREREKRLCTLCASGKIEDENHFLVECYVFNSLREKYNLQFFRNGREFFQDSVLLKLTSYLKEAYDLRETLKEASS